LPRPALSFCTRGAAPAAIIGVGFFDFIHGQRDGGPNGIELHPVLGFSTASCR
jgi:hypothetical protein